jgi:hypothetical protein
VRAAAFVIGGWRAATPRHFVYTALLGLLWTAVTLATVRNASVSSAGPYINATLTMQLNGFAVLLGVLVADRASPPPLHRWWLYVAAVAVGCVIGSSMLWLITGRLLGLPTAYGPGPGVAEGFDTFFYRHATHNLVICGMVTFVYVRQRWAAHSVAALRALQLERATIEKQVLESQLAAMQARVEPEFLRTTLAQVERMYEVDARAADRLLNDLITYLRAAIPRSQDPGSTVAREIRLANAYLSIAGMRSKDWLVIDEAGTAIATGARMPPMVMLPLVNHALSHREQARGDEKFAVGLRIRDGNLVVTVHDDGGGFDPDGEQDPGILRIREWLATMHGESAKLTLGKSGGATHAVMEIPYETALFEAEQG